MLKRIADLLLNAQTDPKDINNAVVAIARSNHRTLNVFASLATVFYGVALAAALTLGVNGISQKVIGYFIGFSTTLIIYLCSKIVVPRKAKILSILIPAFQVTLYSAGLFITFVSTPEQLTITLLAMFLVVPQLFSEKPIRATTISLATAAIFATLHLFTDIKPHEICKQELVNMSIFCVLGIMLGAYRSKVGLERFIFEYKMNRLNDQIREEQSTYWRSMADIYVSLVQVDLDTNSYKLIRTNNYINKAVKGNIENYAKNIALVMEATSQPDFLAGVLQFVNPNTVRERLKGKRTITHEFMGKNFGWCRARYIAVNTKDDEIPRHVIFTVENINEQKNREQHLTTMAETDTMTGLFNRQAGSAKIKELLYNDHEGMLCLFDVDKFKSVNDTFGHQTGDAVIIAVANAMRKAFRDKDILMRLGGDEFIVFANDVKTEELGAKVIQRFFSILDDTRIEGHEDYRISVSLGATFAGKSDLFEDLYKQADTCTYESKKITGKSFTFHRG